MGNGLLFKEASLLLSMLLSIAGHLTGLGILESHARHWHIKWLPLPGLEDDTRLLESEDDMEY